jgi:hypothetical protein
MSRQPAVAHVIIIHVILVGPERGCYLPWVNS